MYYVGTMYTVCKCFLHHVYVGKIPSRCPLQISGHFYEISNGTTFPFTRPQSKADFRESNINMRKGSIAVVILLSLFVSSTLGIFGSTVIKVIPWDLWLHPIQNSRGHPVPATASAAVSAEDSVLAPSSSSVSAPAGPTPCLADASRGQILSVTSAVSLT